VQARRPAACSGRGLFPRCKHTLACPVPERRAPDRHLHNEAARRDIEKNARVNLAHGSRVVWGAQAASLLSSQLADDFQRKREPERKERAMSFSAGCRKGQAGSLCSPESNTCATQPFSTQHSESRSMPLPRKNLSAQVVFRASTFLRAPRARPDR